MHGHRFTEIGQIGHTRREAVARKIVVGTLLPVQLENFVSLAEEILVRLSEGAPHRGDNAFNVLGDAKVEADLGKNFGANLTEREVNWLVENEFARTAEDIVWRRSKLGLRLTTQEIDVLDAWLAKAPATSSQQHAV